MGLRGTDRLWRCVICALCAVLLISFLVLIYPYAKPFPYADDWSYVFASTRGWSGFFHWVMRPHNVHYIPLMKLSQYISLELTGFDFRPLILGNVLLAFAGTVAAFLVSGRLRGSFHFGDVIIPLCLLNYGYNYFIWGFQAQFVVSTAGSIFFIYLMGRATSGGSQYYLVAAYGMLSVVAMTGLNGLIVATATSVMMVSASLVSRARDSLHRASAVGAATVLTLCVPLLLTTPRTVPSLAAEPNYGAIASWLYGLSKSTLVIGAFNHGFLKSGVLTSVAVAAAIGGIMHVTRQLRYSQRIDIFGAAAYSVFLSSLAVLLSVAIGRSGERSWPAGMELHYGVLMAPVPVLAWILLSAYTGKITRTALAVILLAFYVPAFFESLSWRLRLEKQGWSSRMHAMYLIGSSMPPKGVVEAARRELVHVDTPEMRSMAEKGIAILRDMHSPVYRVQQSAR